jgi:tetratricopeptide (TPR) repeat protein
MITKRVIPIGFILIVAVLIAPRLSAQTTQTAKTSGACSPAINAATGATVFSTINCAAIDAKTKAAIQKFEKNGVQNARIDRGQAQAIATLRISDANHEQRIKQLEETVSTLLVNAQLPTASAEDVTIGAAIERGDATSAARLIRTKVIRNDKDNAKGNSKLYLQEAQLLATKDIRLAIRAASDSVKTDPSNFVAWIALTRLYQDEGSLAQASTAASNALKAAIYDTGKAVAELELADIAQLQGQRPTQMEHISNAEKLIVDALTLNPSDNQLLGLLSSNYQRLGHIYQDDSKFELSIKNYQKAEKISQNLALKGYEYQYQIRNITHIGRNVAKSLSYMGRYDDLIRYFNDSLTFYDKIFKISNTEDDLFDKMVFHLEFSEILVDLGKFDMVNIQNNLALQIADKLEVLDKNNLKWKLYISYVHHRIGELALNQSKYPDALTALTKSFLIRKALFDKEASNIEYEGAFTEINNSLAEYYVKFDDFKNAWLYRSQAHLLLEKRGAKKAATLSDKFDLGKSYLRNGDILQAQEKYDKAYIQFSLGANLIEKIISSDSKNTSWDHTLSLAYGRKFNIEIYRDDNINAIKSVEKRKNILMRLIGLNPDNVNWAHSLYLCHDQLGRLAETNKNVAGAIREFEAGKAILVALLARVGDHPGFARDLANVRADISRLRGV